MKAIFLPTVVLDLEGKRDALEESTLIYLEAYNCFLRGIFAVFACLMVLGILVLLLALGLWVGFSKKENHTCGWVLFLVGLLGIGALYETYGKYRAFFCTSALAKTYLRLDVIPFNETYTLLGCALLPPDSICYNLVNPVEEIFVRRNGSPSFEDEIKFLRCLDRARGVSKESETYELRVWLLEFSDELEESLRKVIARGLDCSEVYYRYVNYYSPPNSEKGIDCSQDVHRALRDIEKGLEFLQRAKDRLQQETREFLNNLGSLRDQEVSPLSLSVEFDQIFSSFQQTCEENLRAPSPLVRHLMFETREKVREEIAPTIEEMENQYRRQRTEISGRYKERITGVEESWEEKRDRVQHQIEECLARLASARSDLKDRRERMERLESWVEELTRNLYQLQASDMTRQEATIEGISPPGSLESSWVEKRLEGVLYKHQIEVAKRAIEDVKRDLEKLARQIREDEERIEEKRRELQKLETDFRSRREKLSQEEQEELNQMEQEYRDRIEKVRAPLREIESYEKQLLDIWDSLVKRLFLDKTVVDRYRKMTSAIISYREEAINALYEQALGEIDELASRLYQSKQRITSFLWPRDLWRDCSALFIPAWFLLLEEGPGREGDEKIEIRCFPPGSRSFDTSHEGSFLNFLPGFKEILDRIASAHSYDKEWKEYLRRRSILRDTTYLARYLPTCINRYLREGQIGQWLAFEVRLSLLVWQYFAGKCKHYLSVNQ